MSEKIIVLPGHDEMLRRLLGFSKNKHLQQEFYPVLLEVAGKQFTIHDFLMFLTLAIHDYVKGMPPEIASMLYVRAPVLINAVISDSDVIAEIQSILREIIPATQ